MSEKDIPPLGPDGIEERICHRFMGMREDGSWIPCGKPARIHIFWTEGDSEWAGENGYVCEEHREEAITRWSWYAWHPLGACCGMPGALFFPAENVCRYDDDGLPVAEKMAREKVA
jgi:hypothetical protein